MDDGGRMMDDGWRVLDGGWWMWVFDMLWCCLYSHIYIHIYIYIYIYIYIVRERDMTTGSLPACIFCYNTNTWTYALFCLCCVRLNIFEWNMFRDCGGVLPRRDWTVRKPLKSMFMLFLWPGHHQKICSATAEGQFREHDSCLGAVPRLQRCSSTT